MSDERRCGIFWIRHVENRRSLVCGSEMDAESEEMEAATASVHVVKNLDAKLADPGKAIAGVESLVEVY